MNDGSAIKQIAIGDFAALKLLYQNHRADVYRLAFMMTKQTAYAEDITQEVFLTVIEKAHTYRTDISAKAWLLKITRNKSLNFLKNQTRLIPLDENHLDIGFDTIERDIEFLDSLKCLPVTGRQIVLFHIAYELSHKEVSKILGMSHNAVRKQYERALDVLETNIKKGW